MKARSKISWSERISMLSIHPDIATRDDVARLAVELAVLRGLCFRLVEYRKRTGPKEFQFEKADVFMDSIRIALQEI